MSQDAGKIDWIYASGSIAFFGIITNALTLIYFVKQERYVITGYHVVRLINT